MPVEEMNRQAPVVLPGLFLHFIGACEIRVASLAALRDLLRQARLETFERAQSLVVRFPAEIGDGAWLFKE